ncbi:MAG: hypothetical protein ACI9FN_003403 [Saprospiraceae bacterium]|jgi:hypothetical protein
MKRILALVFFVAALAITGSAQFKFGAGVGLLEGRFGVQAKAHNTFTEDFAGQGSFTYYFESGATVWSLDLDVHYKGFNIGDVEGFSLAPFAGLNIYRVSVSAGNFNVGASATGLNVGINGTLPITDSLDLYIEPKIVIGGAGSFGIAAGVYF